MRGKHSRCANVGCAARIIPAHAGQTQTRSHATRNTAEYLAHGLPDERIVVFDTETTGLDNDDEVLQVSAVDGARRPLLNEYIHPTRKTSWEGAYAIHGISPRDVEHAPILKQIKTKLDKIFSSASLNIAYNIEFDDRMLRQSGYSIRDVAPQTPCIDVMLDYAAMVRQSYGNEYKWQPLQGCAAHYGVDFEAHDSAQDAKATAKCFKCMTYDAEYQLHAVVPRSSARSRRKSPLHTKTSHTYEPM